MQGFESLLFMSTLLMNKDIVEHIKKIQKEWQKIAK